MKNWASLLCCAIICITAVCAVAPNTNPFSGATLYINPTYWNEVENAISLNPTLTKLLDQVQNVSTANWLDTMAKIGNITKLLSDAENIYMNTDTPVVVPFVIYNLPDRDCSAGASNGEIPCADANCTAGIAQYKSQYIDPIVNAFTEYPNVRIVAIVEPDALPNLATNLNIAKCAQAEIAYYAGISYAVQQFATLTNVWVYLDAAHGGWIGWDSNREAYMSAVNTTLLMAGGYDLIRGFATNVANYQPLGSNSSTADPCGLLAQYNNAIDEVHYARLMGETADAAGITGKAFIIDTSRNGVPDARSSCSDWCNIRKAGFGIASTANTAVSELSIIDAFYWVKTPGESDGTSDTSSPRYDTVCTSADAMTPAPEAGVWWPQYFVNLAENSPYLIQLPKNGGVALSASLLLIVCTSILALLVA